ncbi:MAG: ATP-grasp domain-containing protein [Planctomycetes bacterium]|nr:ATP-grasp domain-containing protein [Planctomycetota bacterium]
MGTIRGALHVLFIAPDTSVYALRFLHALKRSGARLHGIGHSAYEGLSADLRACLDGYARARTILDGADLARIAGEIAPSGGFARVETIDEPAVVSAAHVRSVLGLPGTTVETAILSRDKAAMKERLRARGLPCAASQRVESEAEAREFAARTGFPLVIKPTDGFGTLETFRCASDAELDAALARLKPAPQRPAIAEEFIEGHEGFLDAIVADGRVVHDFVGHYYPTCLEALADRAICPKIACTNRVASEGYAELRATGQQVINALGIRDGATHMEWFFGPKGLKVSEIGARPAGERIWDMHAAGNEFDIYGAWAEAVLHGRASGKPSRRFATGSVQIRPPKDGVFLGHEGVERVRRELGDALFEHEVPPPGARTQPLTAGWHVNTWFRLRDEDYDRLHARLEFVARTVVPRVR